MRIIQRDLQLQLGGRATAIRERIAATVGSLAPTQLDAHPEQTGWSIGQVLEHLCLAGELSEAPALAVMNQARADAAAPSREWAPSFIGGFIASALSKPKPLTAARAFQPGPAPRAGVVDVFLEGERRFAKEMAEATELDWRALRVRSAALPSWVPTMNLGDGFVIHTVHVERHARQIERLAAKL